MSTYGFTGREWDGLMGLYYYRARYYDPKIGRFLSEDSAGIRTADNRYVYVENSAPNSVDPTGHYTVNTGNRLFDKKVDAAIDELINVLIVEPDGSCCLSKFRGYDVDLLESWLKQGTFPRIDYDKNLPFGNHGWTTAPWLSLAVNYNEVMNGSLCRAAGYILHEMGHLARQDYIQQEDFSEACSFGCVDVGPPHGPPGNYHQ